MCWHLGGRSCGGEHVGLADRRPRQPAARVEFAAKGRVEGPVAPEGVAVPPELGRDIDFSLAGNAARDGSAVDLSRLSAEGAGLALTGAGQLAGGGQTLEGNFSRLLVADLRPFSGFAGHQLAGSIELAADATREGTSGFQARLQGSASGLRTGIAAGDALLGERCDIDRLLEAETLQAHSSDQLAVAGAAASLSGDARFDSASNRLAAAVAFQLPRLKPLGPAFGTEMAGAISGRIDAEGALDHLRLKGDPAGDESRPAEHGSTGCGLGARSPTLPSRTQRSTAPTAPTGSTEP